MTDAAHNSPENRHLADDLSIRTIAMPADANPDGDVFGGWIMAQMDMAAGTRARLRAKGRVATVAVEAMTLHSPVLIGDELSCYTHIQRVGRSSIAVEVEAWVRRHAGGEHEKVTSAVFTLVAIDADRNPRPVPAQ